MNGRLRIYCFGFSTSLLLASAGASAQNAAPVPVEPTPAEAAVAPPGAAQAAEPAQTGQHTPPADPAAVPAAAAAAPGASTAAVATAEPEPVTALEAANGGKDAAAPLERAGKRRRPDKVTLGLSPGAPQVATLPGGVTPAFGSQPTRAQDWRFDFHGFLQVPLRFGVNKRESAGPDQKVTVLHTPPRVPGEFETFEYTAVSPDPWVQLNFSYGNPHVIATIIVAARTVSNANSYFNPPDMLGINDAFLTFRTGAAENVELNLNVGAFSNRYGNAGEYDMGRYGTPLIAAVNGTGLTGTSLVDLGDVDLVMELGFQGQLNKTPVGVEPAGWNGYADPNVGTSFAGHGHATLGYRGVVAVGGHYIYTFAQDDRATGAAQPDGNISTVGGDVRFTLGRFGHLYGALAHTSADSARSVSSVLRILNAGGGPGLMEEYFGPASEGTGELLVAGGQYDLSLGNVLRYPLEFEGNGPDIVVSAFGAYAGVNSPNDPVHDGVNKLKYGTEVAYSMIRWFALGGRYDRVMADVDDATQTHAILTARAIFHTDWNSNDQVTLQYSHYLNGSGVSVKEGYPPARDPTIEPDGHVLSLMGSMWW